MEQSQLETIDTICQNMQLMASVLQEFVRKTYICYHQNISCLYKYDFLLLIIFLIFAREF